jgi:L-asparaginase II
VGVYRRYSAARRAVITKTDAQHSASVRVWRGAEIESVHAVDAAFVDADGAVLALYGKPGTRAYLRSSAKPIQVLPLIERGLVDRFGFTPAEIAVMVASHSGEPAHVELVRTILVKAQLDTGSLQCGPHEPLHPPTAMALRGLGEEPSRLHNNCSGKHAGMLTVCKAEGWPLDTYCDPEHPLQRRIRSLVAELAGVDEPSIGVAVDGCGLPTFALSIRSMATAYARLAAADQVRDTDLSRAVGIAFDAMAAHPEYVAGTDRLCTAVMSAHGEHVIVKTGAEGVYCGAIRKERRGLALKVVDGARRAQDVALVAMLVELGVIDSLGLDSFERPPVTNWAGKVVGHIDAEFTVTDHR